MQENHEQSLTEHIQQTNAELQQMVAERTHELMKTNLSLRQEINERKKAEAALRASEVRFRQLADSAFEGIFIHDNGRIIDVNQAMMQMSRYDYDEVIGKDLMSFIAPESRELVLRNLRSDDDRPFEVLMKKKDGGILMIEGHGKPIIYEGKQARVVAIRDITERKKAEEALRESKEKYRNILENINDGYFEVDLQGNLTFCNKVLPKSLGYSQEEIMGINYRAYMDVENAEIVTRIFRNVYLDNIREQVINYKVIRKDGTTVHVETSLSLRKSKDGRPIGFRGIVRDITERKKAEEALSKSESKYRNLFNNAQDAIFLMRDDLFIDCNDATLRIYGCTKEQIVGNYPYIFSPPFQPDGRDSKEKALEKINGALSGKPQFFEWLHCRYDGSLFHAEVSLNSLEIRNETILQAIVRDITDRKQAEEAIRHSEERFSKAFHMSPAPTAISTLDDGRYVDVNDSFLRMLGYSREEMVGRAASELNVWANYDDRKRIAQKLTEQGPLRGELLRLQTKNGVIRDVLLSAETITLNEKIYILSIFYDITDQRKLENQLRRAQKMEAVGTLAGGIAHDFNNILGGVMGYTEMALRESEVSDRLRRYLEQIYKAGARARDLVKQILAFSRQSDEKPHPLRVSPIVKEVMNLLRASLPSTIQIHQDIQPDLDTILADGTQIHQILMNLCTNAAHAMPGNKGELTVSLAPMEIKHRDALIIHHGLNAGMYIKLTVRDTGVGITPDIINRIFDPFFTTKMPGEGTGMGLSVVHGIVKSYGGAITVDSKVGIGTEFSVYLPLLTEMEGDPESKAVVYMVGGKERILLVDDEEVLVQVGREMLTCLGYEVTGRTSSLEALELFRARPERFDLVITDMTMPSMTGSELAQEIMCVRPDIPIILCTGFSDTMTQEKARAIGIREFVMKPIVLQQIAAAIRCVLDQQK